MLKNSRKSINSDSLVESRKDYYLVTIDHHAIGVCTTKVNAVDCLKYYAEKFSGKPIDDDAYVFEWENGKHLLSIETAKRIKVPSNVE
jgi:hypothetical protein